MTMVRETKEEQMTRAEILERTIDFDDAIQRIVSLEKENEYLKEIVRHLYKGLDKFYLSGLSEKQIAVIEQLQDKADLFVEKKE